MIETIKKEFLARIVILFYLILVICWLFLQLRGLKGNEDAFQLFTGIYGIIALIGGLAGIFISGKWGGTKSIIGLTILLFSFGLLSQEIGQIIYFYYIYLLKVEIPYPSIGDIGYFATIPFYTYGVIQLAKATGVKIGLRSFTHKISVILLPSVILIISYFFFLKDYAFDWSKPLTIFLDFGYPIGQAINISLALFVLLASRGVLGGVMKSRVRFIIIALAAQYTADFTFLYQAHNGTWTVGGINDLIYLTSYFFMALALLQFNTLFAKLRKND